MSIAFDWEVLSVDSTRGHMIVKFTVPDSPDHEVTLNLSLPQSNANLAEHIQANAPVGVWARVEHRASYLPVSSGEKGSGVASLPTIQGSSVLSGDLQRELLKVLIQEVIDEQNASVV